MYFIDRLVETEISHSFLINKKDKTVTFVLTDCDFKELEKRLSCIFPERYKLFFQDDERIILEINRNRGE